MWFEIKVKSKWIYGLHDILKQLQLTRKQTQEVQRVVFPYIKSTAWNAHSEHVLQTMLCSTNYENRKFAINEILKTR